jgi:hypothetical protein
MRVVVVVGIVVVVVVLVVEVVVVDATSPLHAEMIRTRIRGTATRRMFQPPKQHRLEGGSVNVARSVPYRNSSPHRRGPRTNRV